MAALSEVKRFLPGILLSCLVMTFLASPFQAGADSINGYTDLTYTRFSSKATDSSGQTTRTNSTSYFQRYSLLVDKTIYPKLKLYATGIFEQDINNQKSSGTEIDSRNTRFRPAATLTLQDPLYTAGIGYSLREETMKTSLAPTITTMNEEYSGILGWRPAGLPSLDMRLSKSNSYDTDRVRQDSTKDYISLNSRYAYRGFDLRYLGTYQNTTDKLNGVETNDVTHNGRGIYSENFLNGRALFSTNYNIVKDTVTTTFTGSGTGTVSTQIFPSAGLSLLDDTVTLNTLNPNPALIDGNLTASAGLNIGLPPLGGDTRQRNVGVDFLVPTDVNNLLVWVDRDLPADISSSFSWEIYTSPNNLNWTLLTTVSPAPFDPFLRRFDIDFPSVGARYIKVTVRPLKPTVIGSNNFPDIFITELQAFTKQTSQPGQRMVQKVTSTSQVSNTALRYRILDSSLLYYDFSYFFSKKSASDKDISTLSNGLTANHRFSRILQGTARFAREDGDELGVKRTAYVYNATLTASPLRMLTNSLVYSGRSEEIGGESRTSSSIFLNNTAQLYQGVSVNLNGGYNSSSETDGSKTTSTIIALGSNIVPHRTMNWTFYLTYTSAEVSRPGTEEISTTTKRADVIATYNPFRTLYLFASLQMVDQTALGGGDTGQQGYRTLQNYGLNWSPFPDGALQFRFNYSENRRPQEQVTERIISPGVRYKINNRSFFDVSYQMIRNDNAAQTIDTEVLSANVKIFF